MTKRLLLMATLLGVLLLAGCTFKLEGQGVSPSGAQGLYPPAQQTGVWVTGEGKASYVPDIAVLRLGIEAQEATVAQAQARAREAMGRVVAALKTRKVADKDIQTQHFSIQPVRQWIEEPGPVRKGREIIIGYRVSNTVTAKVRQIDEAGPIIDAVAEAGGDLTRIESISFTIDDPTPLQRQARELAIKDAQAKAQQMAGLLGITLLQPTYVSESAPYIPAPRQFFLEGAAKAPDIVPTPIQPGEQELRVTVQVVYAIK